MSFYEKLEDFKQRHPYKELDLNGAVFRYVLTGKEDARPLVLLNGGMNLSEMWMDYAEALSKTHRVLIFDYPRRLKTNEQLVKGMFFFFKKLGIKHPLLIGASDGGMVAQLYTQRYPESPAGLILISTGGMDKDTLKRLKRKYFFTAFLLWYIKHCNYDKFKKKLIKMGAGYAKHESKQAQKEAQEIFETLFRDYTREKDIHITGLLADLMNQTPVTAEDFRLLKGKILLMLPNKDFFSEKMQENLASLMHDPKIKMIQGGHISTLLRPQEYLDDIEAFLKEIGF